jgi:hypothetical protein
MNLYHTSLSNKIKSVYAGMPNEERERMGHVFAANYRCLIMHVPIS